MIAIGCATKDERAFRRGGARAVETIDDGSSLLLRHHRYESIDAPYNEMLSVAAARDDLEAVVLVHQDAVIDTGYDDLSRSVRMLLGSDANLAVIGAAEIDSPRFGAPDVTATVLVLSPWAVRNLRFDPAIGGSADASAHDIALQAYAGGRRALAAPLGVGRAWAPPQPSSRRRELSAMVELRRKWRSPLTCAG